MRSRYRCSMCPAIHINSRSWLRSSSTHEPSDPPLRMVISFHRFATIVVESHRLVRATDCEPASIRHGAAVTATVFRPSSLLITVTSVEGFVVRLGDRYCGSLNLARLRAPPGRRRPRQVPTVDSCARRKNCERCAAPPGDRSRESGGDALSRTDTRTERAANAFTRRMARRKARAIPHRLPAAEVSPSGPQTDARLAGILRE
jgi:hypothetical protein